MNNILNLQTKRKISLKSAIKKYGVLAVKDPTKFQFEKDEIGVFYNNKYQLLSRAKVSNIVNKKELNPVNILSNNFVINEKDNLVKPRISTNQERKIRVPTINHVLTRNDKQNPYFLKQFLEGKNIRGSGKLIITQNGRVIYEKDIDIGNSVSKWWKNGGFYTGMVESDKYIWFGTNVGSNGPRKFFGNVVVTNPADIKIIPSTDLSARQNSLDERTIAIWSPNVNIDLKKVNQVFRDNDTGTCFFDNALDILHTKKETKLQKEIVNKLTKLKDKYQNGVTEDDIKNIVSSCGINVYITDALNNTYKQYKCNKKDFISINLINNRCDHLDKNKFIDYNSNKTELTEQSDIQKIFLQNIEDKNHFYYIGSLNDIKTIYTEGGTFVYKNLENDKIRDFNESIGIYNYALDLKNSTDNDKYEFISMGVNYNSHCLINDIDCEDSIDFKEYDMKNAYIQYKKNRHYIGFCNIMSHIVSVPQDWDIKKYVGYYFVKIVDIENKNTEKIFSSLGMNINNHYIFSSIMLLHFNDWKIKYKLISGCYSFNSIDIDLTDEMISDKLYCKWTGKLNSVNFKNSINVLGNIETAHVLRESYENVSCNKYFNTNYEKKTAKIELDTDIQEIQINFDKKRVNYLGHIGGFICDYTRSAVIDKLLNYQFDDIIGFKLDGFIVKNNFVKERTFINDKTPMHHIYNCIHDKDSIWTLKPVKYTFEWGHSLFSSCENGHGIMENIFTGIDSFKYQHELVTGVGGAGKTTSILCNELGHGWKDCIFVAGNWRLITEKMNEYNMKGITIHQLIGEGCQPYLCSNKQPAKIIYDECNTYTKEWIEKAFQLYPNSQHILLGDMEVKNNKLHYYQCSGKDINVIDIQFFKKHNIHIENNPNNFRCKDSKLLEILNTLRELQHEKDCMNKSIQYIRDCFGITSIDELQKNYDDRNDWVLCSTTNKELKNKPQTMFYTELLQGKKYLVIRHNAMDIKKRLDGLDSTLKGEIIYNPEKVLEKHERRDAFTIHSFQGLTISKEQTLYFDINRLFDVRQIYTSLSRVEYFNQIKLLSN